MHFSEALLNPQCPQQALHLPGQRGENMQGGECSERHPTARRARDLLELEGTFKAICSYCLAVNTESFSAIQYRRPLRPPSPPHHAHHPSGQPMHHSALIAHTTSSAHRPSLSIRHRQNRG